MTGQTLSQRLRYFATQKKKPSGEILLNAADTIERLQKANEDLSRRLTVSVEENADLEQEACDSYGEILKLRDQVDGLKTPDSWYCPEMNEEGSYPTLEALWENVLKDALRPSEGAEVVPFHDLPTCIVLGVPQMLDASGWPTDMKPAAFANAVEAEAAYEAALENLRRDQ